MMEKWLHDRIERLAYRIWESQGQPNNRRQTEYFWSIAEKFYLEPPEPINEWQLKLMFIPGVFWLRRSKEILIIYVSNSLVKRDLHKYCSLIGLAHIRLIIAHEII